MSNHFNHHSSNFLKAKLGTNMLPVITSSGFALFLSALFMKDQYAYLETLVKSAIRSPA